jgi:hypothetical protein
LDRAALAYGHINDGTARKKQVIVFPSMTRGSTSVLPWPAGEVFFTENLLAR